MRLMVLQAAKATDVLGNQEARIYVHAVKAMVPERVCEILLKCLAPDPEDRYASAGELGYDLEYEMYSKGYGPTIVTLAHYVAEKFPEHTFYAPERRARPRPEPGK